MRTFGQLARAFRKASGRSLYQVAGSCGISQTYLGMIEQGHRNPDLLVRERLKGQLMEVPLGSAWVGLSYWGLSPAYILWDRTLIEDPSAW
jgi:transcriptional regulator with XRE-family HTH domain